MIAGVADWRDRARRFLQEDLWRRDAPGGLRGLGRGLLQRAVLVAQGAESDQILLRASGLAYFTMLSLIPLLAVALGLVEAFGASRDLARFVIEQVAAGSPEAGERILELVERVDFGGLGALGGVSLFLTTVLALGSVEHAFNAIWGVPQQRPLVRRFPDYLAVLVVAPLLLTAALSLAATLRSQAVVQQLLENPMLAQLYGLGLKRAPLVLLFGAFTFLYWFLPNTQVRFVPALAGGALAALLFAAAQSAYVGFNVGVARSSAVFGSFAALPLLLVWIYVSWVVVLLGAEFAFTEQNLASFRQAREGEEPRPAERETLGVGVAAHIAKAFQDGRGGVTDEALAEALDAPVRSVRGVLKELCASGIVAPRGEEREGGYQLARAAETIAVVDVLTALRGAREPAHGRRGDDATSRVLRELDAAAARAVSGRTLADLVGVDPPGPAA